MRLSALEAASVRECAKLGLSILAERQEFFVTQDTTLTFLFETIVKFVDDPEEASCNA